MLYAIRALIRPIHLTLAAILIASLFLTALSGQADAHARRAFGRMPMTFETNQGQANSSVQFLARGQGYTTYLTSSGAVLSLTGPSSAGVKRLSLRLIGASTGATRSR